MRKYLNIYKYIYICIKQSGNHLSCHNAGQTFAQSINGSNTYISSRTSLTAQTVKNLLAVQETWVQSLGREDSLEEEMVTHSRSLAWKIPWTEGPGGASDHGVTKSRTQLND